ncbi:MAG: acetyltransferase [Gammaproteobacteria bacterium]|nr:acetyltransferase [Gammaproteobacteria bacterium]
MAQFDVFNGDADGICSLLQLRLTRPCDSTLITGVKRDIKLLKKVRAVSGDKVTVLDVSLDKNRDDLDRLLHAGVEVAYFDHHYAGDIPDHMGLAANINTAPNIGTCYLVDRYLGGSQRAWAVVGSFGDNLDETANELANSLTLSAVQLSQLRELGRLLNYNGYGESIDDLHFPPDTLYRSALPYSNPLEFIADNSAFAQLQTGYKDDSANIGKLRAERETATTAVYCLPAEKWARRVSGIFANDLASANPQRAHAILTRNSQNSGFVVSVRAPLDHATGADELCRQFETGGGRKAAAGINLLPDSEFERFVDRFNQQYA